MTYSLTLEQAVLSISSPGIRLGNRDAARALARRVNEDGAAAVAAHPGGFGLFASLPLPDIDASLEEIAYASDVLDADGFVLMTNYDGVYPADDTLKDVIAELDRREAVVALRPTSPPGWEAVARGRPRPMLEFPFDTTRAVFDLILSRRLEHHPRIRLIVPHVGSALSVLADRVHAFAGLFLDESDDGPLDVFDQLRRLHYDVTGAALPHALPALLTLTEPGHVVYGSDLPFAPIAAVRSAAEALLDTDALAEEERTALFVTNAAQLLPRLSNIGASNH